MQCPSCGTANVTAARFCSECGTPLGSPCPDCQYINRADAKVCSGCGKRLGAAERAQAERRQLTVFFVDLVGSTAMSEALDPEELRELYSKYQDVCAAVIRGYDGHIAQFLGDGILAYFGYPVAHEDDALRAVHSGLGILTQLDTVQLGPQRPTVRIGVHTGLVVVGDVGTGQRSEQLALGEAPNVAARVQGEADPDTMLISEATRRLVAGHFRLEDLGSRSLKGLSRPMQLWRVLGLSEAASRFDALTAEGLAPFVGREREVLELRAAWERAVHGTGQAVLLRGEAGIGKSRLLGAARSFAAEQTPDRFEAECSPYALNSPLHPVVQMLQRRLGLSPDVPAGERLTRVENFVRERGGAVDEAVPLLAHLLEVPLGDRYGPSDLPPAKQRQRLLTILADLQLHAPGTSPTLMVLEDLHWADPSTLELVAMLVSRQANTRLMLLGSTRPELPELWSPSANRQEIRVQALPRTESRSLVSSVVGKALPEAVMQEIIERTGGIPLFVEAVTRTVLESGVLREGEDRYELVGPLPPGLIPSTVHDSLMARIDRLGAHKSVAQLAATIGREFPVTLLQAVTDKAPAVLDAALRQMIDLDLVSRSGVAPHWTYQFKHALIQDAAYESLLKKTRQEFHGRVADVLRTQFEELVADRPELLARHLEGAGRTREAAGMWMKAGGSAGQRFALKECVAHLRRAIEALEALPADDPERITQETAAQLAIAPALMATEGWGAQTVERACLRAKALCEQTGNGEGLFGALWGLWTVLFVRGEHERALVTARQVLDMALAGPPGIAHVAARHAVGFTHYFLGEFGDARDHAERGLALYSLEQERALVSAFQIPSSICCLAFLTQSLRFAGHIDQARAAQVRLEQHMADLDIPACSAVGLGISQYHYFDRHMLDEVLDIAERGYTLSVDEGFLFWSATMRLYRGWVWAMRGRHAEGIAEMEGGLEDVYATNAGIFVPQWYMMLAQGRRVAGDLPGALRDITTGLDLIERLRERYYLSELLRERATIHSLRGDRTLAEDDLRRAMGVAHQQGAPLLELRSAMQLARGLAAAGRGEEGRALVAPILASFTEGRDDPELVAAHALADVG